MLAAAGRIDWHQLVSHSPVAVDTPDRFSVVCAVAITVLIGAVIVATNRPHRAGGRHRWATRGTLAVAVLASALAIAAAAALPAGPAVAAATSTTFDPRAATAAALGALVDDYRPEAGVWDSVPGEPGWWQSAVDLDDLIAAEQALDTHAYDSIIATTYQQTPNTYAGKIIRWRGPYYDDAAWWGIAWLDAYTWTGRRAYLTAAQGVGNWLERGRAASCGGGVEWGDPTDIARGAQKNTITNALTAALDAGLYQVTHRSADLRRALASWRWLRGTGLVQPGRLVADHLDGSCRPVGVRWSYTQGMTIRAALALTAATGAPGYRATAASIADAATSSRTLNTAGVLHEPCLRSDINCPQFAGPYVLALAELGGHDDYLTRQAEAAYHRDRMVGDRYGLQWAGAPDMSTPGRQASALAALTSTI
jgi:hypothetical protein